MLCFVDWEPADRSVGLAAGAWLIHAYAGGVDVVELLKDHIIKEEEHRRAVLDCIEKEIEMNRRVKRAANKQKHQSEEFLYKPNAAIHTWQAPVSVHRLNNLKHQSTQTWSEDMPDLEGEALADAEKQFDYDSWLGEHLSLIHI